MSILIKGMEMPKLGEEFRVGRDVDGNLFICNIYSEETVWFPLAEVPTPHGRLIDADIVTGVIANSMPSLTTPDGAGQYDHEICVVQETIADDIQTINAQPTVIEAEEGCHE